MSENSSNGKKIAKNTLALYFRMIITMAVGLYTSRVILDSLGIEDYGIYNLVGGFVVMFNVFRAGLLSATQRFITFELGKGDMNKLKKTFSTSLMIFMSLSVVIVLAAEIPGIWFLENKLSIPAERIPAAHWVLQFSLLTLVLNLISFPYNALIIAHEKMKAFAYISIIDVFAKLLIAFLIYISPFDKLIGYAFLLTLVQFIIRTIYTVYCNRHFEESKVVWKMDWSTFKKIYAFTGWGMFGSIAVIFNTQGLNMLLGMFFTPTVNAARGLAVHVQGVISGFVTNFQTALNPQITKSYASDQKDYLHKLIYSSSLFSFYLLFFFAVPIFLEADYLLNLWLVKVPEYTGIFFRLIILTAMVDAISNPITTSVDATGNIKKYQVAVGGLRLTVLPISYFILKYGGEPYSVFMVNLGIDVLAFFVRLFVGHKLVGFPIWGFIQKVLYRILMVGITALIVPVFLHFSMEEGFVRLVITAISSVLITALLIFYLGIEKSERNIVMKFIKSKIKHDK